MMFGCMCVFVYACLFSEKNGGVYGQVDMEGQNRRMNFSEHISLEEGSVFRFGKI